MTEKQYNYGARWSSIFSFGGFFALCALAIAHAAMTNDRGLVQGFIRLGTKGATAFLWFLTAFSGFIVLTSIGLAIRRIVSPRMLVIDARGLSIPHGSFQLKQTRIDFSEILAVSETKVNRHTSLRLKTYDKTFSIAEPLLPSRRDFEDIKSIISSSTQRSAVAEGV